MFKKMNFVIPLVLTMMMLSSGIAEGAGGGSGGGENLNENYPAEVGSEFPAAGQINDSYTPYFGQDYEQPEQVKALYPSPDVDFNTPGFQPGKEDFTSTNELMTFLNELNNSSSYMHMEIVGNSLEGRDIPLLVFSKEQVESDEFNAKPTVWIEAQVHGNEPAAGESALVTAERLAKEQFGEEVLENINVVMLPRKNMDGSHYFQREGVLGLDINRDHMKQDYHESRILNKQFNRFTPEVSLTAHEYGATPNDAFSDIGEEGGAQYYDITLARGYNLNIPESLRDMSDDLFLENVHSDLEQTDYSYDTYTIAQNDNGELSLQETGTEPRYETNTQGLMPSMTFLIESRGIGIGKENFERRVHSQILTQESFLRTTAENSESIKTTVDNAREEIINKGKVVDEDDTIVVTSERSEVSNDRLLEVVDIAAGEVVEVSGTYYSNVEADPTLERVRPSAYILPPGYHHIAERLKMQGVKVEKLINSQELDVETYTITNQETADTLYEGHVMNTVETEVNEETRYFPNGSYVIPMDQTAANFAAMALEPEAVDSYVTFNFIPGNMDDELPIYRYMNDQELEVERTN